MSPITTSIFELFTIGPGPSSSHTIGPMRAGYDFRSELATLAAHDLGGVPARVQVALYGSLAATGEGHGTHWAVLAGLDGMRPEDCPPEILETYARDQSEHTLELARGAAAAFSHRDVTADLQRFEGLGHPNTLVFRLVDAQGAVLREAEYHSVGGGTIRRTDRPSAPSPLVPHQYGTMRQLRRLLERDGLSLEEVIVQNECALSGAEEQAVLAGLDAVLAVMEDSVDRGLAADGELPGPLGLHRKAKAMFKRHRETPVAAGRLMLALDAYALAAAEENAAGHTVVTAPTCGSAGVLASVVRVMRHDLALPDTAIRRGLCAAAAVGLLVRYNASVAGAEVGCQGEIGVAASMGAAMLAMAKDRGMHAVENAAETALEHHLGMACDPVAGYVQIPCIERTAMGAVKAFNAYVIASSEVAGHHMVGLDQAICAMAETGRDMNRKYKETALGGLAVSLVNC